MTTRQQRKRTEKYYKKVCKTQLRDKPTQKQEREYKKAYKCWIQSGTPWDKPAAPKPWMERAYFGEKQMKLNELRKAKRKRW